MYVCEGRHCQNDSMPRGFLFRFRRQLENNLIYKSNSGGVCLSVWAMPGRFFQSLPIPCRVSPDVTDSREKINQGQSDFLRQKI